MYAYALKECARSICHPLLRIYKQSIESSDVPSKWKLANITALPKGGDKLEPGNYRPVSLTSIPCKILEGILRDKIMNHLIQNRLINEAQHGFVKSKSCVTNLLETMDFISMAISNGENVDVLYTDFAKAFDSVPHRRLLLKLESYGIKGKLLEWIKSYLSQRKHRVVMGEFLSDWIEVLSGIPQGSVLGPLLFIIYINDLPDEVSSVCKLYADDNKLITRVGSIEDENELQADIDNLVKWSQQWQIRFNAKKCHIMHFGKSNTRRSYFMNCDSNTHELETSNEERDIGVIISNDLKSSQHINLITTKANKMLGLILNTFSYLDLKSFRQLYCSFVRSQLEFAMSAWNPYLIKDIEALELVQRRATKRAPGLRSLSYEERLKKLNLTTLKERRIRGDLIQQYKIVNEIDRVNWHNKPIFVAESIENSTKPVTRGHKYKMIKESTRDNIRLNFFTNRITNNWNALPKEAVEARSVNSFKAKIDKIYETNGTYETVKKTK